MQNNQNLDHLNGHLPLIQPIMVSLLNKTP